ncbi:ral guanine nucleotide dissociation stimulator-like 1 isoform X2 [Glandiceps talaboti]
MCSIFDENPTDTGSTLYWGEEEKDGVIYDVYLRKIRYNVSSTSSPAFTDPEFKQESQTITCGGNDGATGGMQWETKQEFSIKAASIEKLVGQLSQAMDQMNSSFINVFFNTYQTFTTPFEVLNLLLQRYISACDKNNTRKLKKGTRLLIKKSVQSVLTMWLDEYSNDFRQPPSYPCLTTLIDFAMENISEKEIEEKCKRKLERWRKEDIYGIDLSSVSLNFDSTSEGSYTFSLCEEVDNMIDNMMSYPKLFTFQDFPQDVIAVQLTYLDAELFMKVIPQHCLGAIWSKREKDESVATTVKATVDQFNKVSYHVIATILSDAAAKPSIRSKVITKWINIAQECRNLKNFSSLKAILSGLQKDCIHRLKRTWAAVPRDTLLVFEELSEIFCQDNNHEVWREILMKEGTAKFVDGSSTFQSRTIRRQTSKKNLRKVDNSTVHGTVPYLGTFLTDLMMIHSAFPDILENGYVNFNKKRKEFELLAQIKLLQKAAQTYNIDPDSGFQEWFDGIKIQSDDRSYQLSCIIEPVCEKPYKPPHKAMTLRYKREPQTNSKWRPKSEFFQWSSGSSGSSTSSEDQSSVDSGDSAIGECKRMSRSSSCSSFLSLDSSLSYTSSPFPSPTSQSPPLLPARFVSQDSCVIKVSLDEQESRGNMYKSIRLSHEEHTTAVIVTALCKHCIQDKYVDQYSLLQVLPDGTELQIPDRSNVFYAMNQAVPDLKFILRRKSTLSASESRPVMKKKNRLSLSR